FAASPRYMIAPSPCSFLICATAVLSAFSLLSNFVILSKNLSAASLVPVQVRDQAGLLIESANHTNNCSGRQVFFTWSIESSTSCSAASTLWRRFSARSPFQLNSLTVSRPGAATPMNVNPTGLSEPSVSGPATPVIETARSAPRPDRAPSAIAEAASALAAPRRQRLQRRPQGPPPGEDEPEPPEVVEAAVYGHDHGQGYGQGRQRVQDRVGTGQDHQQDRRHLAHGLGLAEAAGRDHAALAEPHRAEDRDQQLPTEDHDGHPRRQQALLHEYGQHREDEELVGQRV